jgi:hypothetical protein
MRWWRSCRRLGTVNPKEPSVSLKPPPRCGWRAVNSIGIHQLRTSKHRRSAETHVAVSASAVSSPMRVKRDPWNRRKHSPSSSPASGGAASEERGAERGARVISG